MRESYGKHGLRGVLGIAFLLALALPALAFDINTIPDGYTVGRAEAPYGTYCTPFAAGCRVIGEELEFLARKAHGLAGLGGDEIRQAEAAYFLENRLIRLYRLVLEQPADKLSAFERHALLNRVLRVYRTVRTHAERHYQSMVRTIDIVFPGPNGVQIRRDQRDGSALYDMNCRRETCPTEKEQRDFYDDKLKKFLKEGGNVDEMVKLDATTVAKFGPITRLEYVERENGEVWVTAGKAGHALLAEGGRVRSAGQLVLVKDTGGNVALLVASNASGTYKPDLHSVNLLTRKLQAELRIPPDAIVTTEGEPLGTQTVAVLMKAGKIGQDAIKAKVKAMEAQAKALLADQSPIFVSSGPSCGGLFGLLK